MLWITGLLLIIFSIATLTVVFKIFSLISERLNQMNQSIQEANKVIGQGLGSTTQIFGTVQEKLGRLEETNRQIYEVSKDISRLQELLRAPKFRGQMGEILLEGLLAQVLPSDYYQMQYRFKSSDTVDAVIKLGDGLIPIDAKFSLENFQKMIEAEEEQVKNAHRKKFIQDVKTRIDEIASKYILPSENTYDFALMYIPAENVYYEIAISEDIFSYGITKRVFAVSPNTFYVYLQIICMGLKGLKIEENAKAILKNLSMLGVEISKFKEDFELIGCHLVDAMHKYEDSQKRLQRFADRLLSIQEEKKI